MNIWIYLSLSSINKEKDTAQNNGWLLISGVFNYPNDVVISSQTSFYLGVVSWLHVGMIVIEFRYIKVVQLINIH